MRTQVWLGWGLLGILTAALLAPLPRAWGEAAADAAAEAAEDGAPAPEAGRVVGWLELSGPLREGPPPFAWVSEADAGPSLQGVLRQLRHVAEGDDYLGVVLYLDYPELGMTQIEAIAASIAAVRATGKKVFTFAEAYDLPTYLLACSADQILLQQRGQVMIPGIGVEEMYLAGLLEKIGMKADFVQVGKFKGAQDPLTRTGPSPEWDQNIDALLDDVYASVLERIATGRNMTQKQVEALFADAWTMTDADYVRRRVVDRVVDRDLISVTEVEFGDDFVWDDSMGDAAATQTQTNAFAFFQTLFQASAPRPRRQSIAVVHANGPIMNGESTYGDGLFSGDTIGSRTISEVLSDAAEDDLIKGVVIRVDSPGGSAMASEVIWQSVRSLAEAKPVFVSVGSTAASGGYYIACAADEIYVNPDSIVGSIGVVGGKLIAGGLYEKIGVHVHRRSRGPLGDMFNSVEPFSDRQRELLRSAFEKTYAQFTERVRTGRGARLADVEGVAQGRLFTGRQAVKNGLADQLGDVGDAVRAMAGRLNLEPGAYDVVNLPPPMSLPEFLEQMFGGRAGAQASLESSMLRQTAEKALGSARWRAVRDVLGGLVQLQREPVLTLMPAAIVIR